MQALARPVSAAHMAPVCPACRAAAAARLRAQLPVVRCSAAPQPRLLAAAPARRATSRLRAAPEPVVPEWARTEEEAAAELVQRPVLGRGASDFDAAAELEKDVTRLREAAALRRGGAAPPPPAEPGWGEKANDALVALFFLVLFFGAWLLAGLAEERAFGAPSSARLRQSRSPSARKRKAQHRLVGLLAGADTAGAGHIDGGEHRERRGGVGAGAEGGTGGAGGEQAGGVKAPQALCWAG